MKKKGIKRLLWSGVLLITLAIPGCELLETPEYPDSGFSIVGTWEYTIPPCVGTDPAGDVFNAKGRITFTDDMKFSFEIDSDKGKLKGYGTYGYDEDSGLSLDYTSYEAMLKAAVDSGYYNGSQSFHDAINWGNSGDIVEQDYLKVHSAPVTEYFRIDPQPYVEEVVTYENYDELKDETSWGMIMHDGMCGLELPVNYVPFTKP